MFTGIVEEVGRVAAVAHRGAMVVVEIEAHAVVADTRVGDSIAVGGACLTAVDVAAGGFTVELTPETLRRTTLGGLAPGAAVNLERAVAAGGRFGGHIVQGHVDACGTVEGLAAEGESTVVRFLAPPDVLRYVVPKGFIAVDGVSLTVVDRDAEGFRIAYIPHTLAHTTAGAYRPGTRVNLEPDILGKYVEQLLAGRPAAVPTILEANA